MNTSSKLLEAAKAAVCAYKNQHPIETIYGFDVAVNCGELDSAINELVCAIQFHEALPTQLELIRLLQYAYDDTPGWVSEAGELLSRTKAG
jgi:hypothetical protein